ncbi:hypothetical protein [Pseudoalteromonas sp.]|jgi:dipeptide/tripeptide permease|uniref:hypothetical protein n=1 Tax=Pseudoalteromonas sp. TaxID=53249 RepID=UPI00356A986F
MNINATFFGELLAVLLLLCVPLFAWLSYRLGKRKTTTPVLVAIIGGVLGLIPIFALIFVAVLCLKNDLTVPSADV